MRINVIVIPHEEQRYETIGDWWFEGIGVTRGNTGVILQIRVSDLGNWKYESLIAMHEQIEAMLCLERGIDEQEVTRFDKSFERNRTPEDKSEPGDSKYAPYNKEHFFATSVERLLAAEFGINWEDYDNAIYEL